MTRAASVAGVTRTIFTDLKGNTLYYEANDTGGKLNCTGQCAVIWPPLLAPAGESTIPPVFTVPGKFATIADPDGKQQVTYNGWPLFAFSKDPKPGDITGEGVAGRWHAASTDLQPSA
jgi:predicted lipoprotein with Yx(FWY)xxD motif